MENQEIINRVKTSSLISIDLEEWLNEENVSSFDLAPALFQGLVLREKEFRDYLKEYLWDQFQGKWVNIFCSAEAIIPMWAYMLVATKLQPVCKGLVFGSEVDLEKEILKKKISDFVQNAPSDAKVVVKGCSKLKAPAYAFVELSNQLSPKVSSLMYGEPCSTVPVYKKPKR